MTNRLPFPIPAVALLGALLASMLLALAIAPRAEARGPEPPVNLAIRLVPGPNIPDTSGRALFQARSGEQALSIWLKTTARLSGKTLDVYLQGRHIGQLHVNSDGLSRLHLSSVNGDRLPPEVYGMTLRVVGPNNVLIAYGKFPPAP